MQQPRDSTSPTSAMDLLQRAPSSPPFDLGNILMQYAFLMSDSTYKRIASMTQNEGRGLKELTNEDIRGTRTRGIIQMHQETRDWMTRALEYMEKKYIKEKVVCEFQAATQHDVDDVNEIHAATQHNVDDVNKEKHVDGDDVNKEEDIDDDTAGAQTLFSISQPPVRQGTDADVSAGGDAPKRSTKRPRE